MNITRTFDLLDRYQVKFDKENALSIKRKGKWATWNTKEYISLCHDFAYGLLQMGLKKGDKIITATNNRPEWNFVDHGMAMCGVIHVPVYTSLNETEYHYIIEHSEACLGIVSDKKLFNKLEEGFRKTGKEDKLYTFDRIENLPCWEDILHLGRDNRDHWISPLEEIKSGISEKDFASLLYTSGTTGLPKGVMLSHENLVKNFIAAAGIFNLDEKQKYLSILPLCHVGGRLGNYQSQYSGTTICYAESMGTFVHAMKEQQANGFDAVPRILEKVYDNIISKGNQLKGFKKKLFFWAIDLGFRYNSNGRNSLPYKLKLFIADRMIFSKWREAMGGKVSLVGCGGASLQPKLEKLFWAAGVKIINMYGLTETSPIITINSTVKGKFRLGTVGTLIDGVELKIANDGEILCRGHNVMLGYFKDEALTKEVFDEEGWFHTGDIGHLQDGKFLAVTDRKKEIFKLSNGKYIAPQLIEGIFKQSEFIDQLMVIGEHQKFTSAIIVPDYEIMGKWCDKNNIAYSNHDELICMPEVQLAYQAEIDRMNKQLSNHEKILRFRLVSDVWTPESGELSPTLKLKRKIVYDKYSQLINTIYNQ